MNSRFIVFNDPAIDRVYLGAGRYFDFARLQKQRGRSWHSRPYEYRFVIQSMQTLLLFTKMILENIIDLACGINHPGYLLIADYVPCNRIVALDNDQSLLTNTMDHPKVKKVIGDAAKTGFKDGSFGAISCVSALEHMPKWYDCIHEMSRLLKPGGMAFVTMDISTDPAKTAKRKVGFQKPGDYKTVFEDAGLKIFGDYDDHLPDDAVDTICSKYPLAASESELLDGQHRALKTFRMVLRKDKT